MRLPRRIVALAMLLGLPLLTYYLWMCLTFNGGALIVPHSVGDLQQLATRIPVPTATSVLLYGSWVSLQVLLHIFAPGDVRRGAPNSDGSRLLYRMNGWFSFWATWAVLILAIAGGLVEPTVAYDQCGPLMTTANLTAFALAFWLYLRARREVPTNVEDGLRDYVFGASLNPRIREFDVKFFCEGRPGLMLWTVLNASFAAKQYELHGTITTPMLLVNAFQFLYVADYFRNEEAILTTWDIKHERFGWMLCWGCLVWVPFTFSIQAYYLVTHTHDLSTAAAIAIVALNVTGYAIFRSANLQKHRFRRDPSRPVWGRPPQYIRTASGALLLTSGWWGLARHLNYLGDLMMGLAWCLTAGFGHPVPYFYIVYFLILLIHRERRDHAMCLQKYGPDWEAYCRKVPWRIVPGLY